MGWYSSAAILPCRMLFSSFRHASSAPPTPVLTADDVVPVLQTLSQVSEQHFTEAFNA
ncbi:hypothetical protein KIN20_006084, partial [Parelaphostrongylus tenuis]